MVSPGQREQVLQTECGRAARGRVAWLPGGSGEGQSQDCVRGGHTLCWALGPHYLIGVLHELSADLTLSPSVRRGPESLLSFRSTAGPPTGAIAQRGRRRPMRGRVPHKRRAALWVLPTHTGRPQREGATGII